MIKIGLTLSIENKGSFYEFSIPSDYVSAVIECGGFPVLIPSLNNHEAIDKFLEEVDGIIMTGGDDISPELYGEDNRGLSINTSPQRDEAEIYLLGRALELGYPVLGICRGFQLINVYSGGALFQDLEKEFSGGVVHRNMFRNPEDLHHEVNIGKESLLSDIICSDRFMVNSRHHQGIRVPGRDLTVTAYSDDGLVEAVENRDLNIIAVQWHPENLVSLGGVYRSLFENLVKRCEVFRGKKTV